MDTSMWTRILLRYGIGALVVWGILPESWAEAISTDSDIQMLVQMGMDAAIGLTAAFVVEQWMLIQEKRKAEKEAVKQDHLKAQIEEAKATVKEVKAEIKEVKAEAKK